MSGINHYQLLRVPRTAGPEQIRQAYVRLIKHIHPDLAGSDRRPSARLQDLQCAYRCLLDPDARRRYDAELADSETVHIERLRRVERRLAHRRRRQNRSWTIRRQPASGIQRGRWRIILLILGGIVAIAKVRSVYPGL